MPSPPARPPPLPASAFDLPGYTAEQDAFITFHWSATDMSWQMLTTLYNHQFSTNYPDWIVLHGSLFYRYCHLRHQRELPDVLALKSPIHSANRPATTNDGIYDDDDEEGGLIVLGDDGITTRKLQGGKRKRLFLNMASPPRGETDADTPELSSSSPSPAPNSAFSGAATGQPAMGTRVSRTLPLRYKWLHPGHFSNFWRNRGVPRPYRWIDQDGEEVFVDDDNGEDDRGTDADVEKNTTHRAYVRRQRASPMQNDGSSQGAAIVAETEAELADDFELMESEVSSSSGDSDEVVRVV